MSGLTKPGTLLTPKSGTARATVIPPVTPPVDPRGLLERDDVLTEFLIERDNDVTTILFVRDNV